MGPVSAGGYAHEGVDQLQWVLIGACLPYSILGEEGHCSKILNIEDTTPFPLRQLLSSRRPLHFEIPLVESRNSRFVIRQFDSQNRSPQP